jgi:hypothetical protein
VLGDGFLVEGHGGASDGDWLRVASHEGVVKRDAVTKRRKCTRPAVSGSTLGSFSTAAAANSGRVTCWCAWPGVAPYNAGGW